MKALIALLVIVTATSAFFIGVTATEYNPWCDQDSDGDIDIFDIVPAATAYGTTGDPTKNVTVTNWPSDLDVNITNWRDLDPAIDPLNISLGSVVLSGYGTWYSPYIQLTGYKEYYLYVTVIGTEMFAEHRFKAGGLEICGEAWETHSAPISDLMGPYLAKGPEFRIKLTNRFPHSGSVELAIFAWPS